MGPGLTCHQPAAPGMPPLLQALTAPPFQHLAPTALLQAIWQRNNPVGLHPQLGLILGCSQRAGQLTAPHPQWGGGARHKQPEPGAPSAKYYLMAPTGTPRRTRRSEGLLLHGHSPSAIGESEAPSPTLFFPGWPPLLDLPQLLPVRILITLSSRCRAAVSELDIPHKISPAQGMD